MKLTQAQSDRLRQTYAGEVKVSIKRVPGWRPLVDLGLVRLDHTHTNPDAWTATITMTGRSALASFDLDYIGGQAD